jgi:hypothetical protein
MSLFPRAINEYLTLQGIPRGPNSQVYLVDPTTGVGDDDNPGTSFAQPLATLAAAEDLCVAGQHDTVLYLGGAQSISLAAALTWDKSYTHLVGWCAPTGVANRARIFQTGTLTGASPLLNITATGCIFRNFYIFQGVNDATSLINVAVTGGRNYFRDVHFAGGGHAAQAINGGASLKLDGAEENVFERCTVGVDTIAAATGMVGILFDGAAHRNIFRNCHVSMLAGHAGAAWVEVVDGTGIDRYTIFDNCLFTNTNKENFEMTSGFVIPAVAGNRPARIFLKDCVGYGAAKWDADDRGVLMGNMNAVTGADLSGVAVEMVT